MLFSLTFVNYNDLLKIICEDLLTPKSLARFSNSSNIMKCPICLQENLKLKKIYYIELQ